MALAAMLTGIGVWLVMHYLSLRSARRPHSPSRLRTSDDSAEEIARVRKRYANGNYREGCHEISRILKAYFERKTGLQIEEMTAAEIARVIEGKPAAFFRELSALQFGRNEPERSDFERVCRDSAEVRKARVRVVGGALS